MLLPLFFVAILAGFTVKSGCSSAYTHPHHFFPPRWYPSTMNLFQYHRFATPRPAAAARLLLSECTCMNTSCWKCLHHHCHRARNVNSSEIYIRSKLAGDEVYYDVIKIVLMIVWGELLQLQVSIIISQEYTSQSASSYLLIPLIPESSIQCPFNRCTSNK